MKGGDLICKLCEIAEIAKSEPVKALSMIGAFNLALDVAELEDSKIDIESMMQYAEIKQKVIAMAQMIALACALDSDNATLH